MWKKVLVREISKTAREISKTAPAGTENTKSRQQEKVKLQKIATLKRI